MHVKYRYKKPVFADTVGILPGGCLFGEAPFGDWSAGRTYRRSY